MSSEIYEITHEFASIWIATDNQPGVDYSYGGTRMVRPHLEDVKVYEVLERLMFDESQLKNQLINIALRRDALSAYEDRVPSGFLESRVGGARCVIRPRTQKIASILANPEHPEFYTIISQVFKQVGSFLNDQQGKIKLTPDFGRFAGLADILAEFTSHVLGIRCEDGGCGGKASYTSTGIIAAFETVAPSYNKNEAITLIGSAGALGSDVLAYFLREDYTNLAICDLVYDGHNGHNGVTAPNNLTQLPSKQRAFTEPCLRRGGVIIATTVGHELEHSAWQVMPLGTILLLAHNLSIPTGEAGVELMRKISAQSILALPGQILTLGGALTSRLEWFWRQSKSGLLFDKELAHLIVQDVVKFWVQESLASSEPTPYEFMSKCTQLQPQLAV